MIDVSTAEAKARRGEFEQFYGFDPDREYLVRSRYRRYNGVSRGRRFTNGENVIGRVPGDSTLKENWERGELLSRFRGDRYAVYIRGEQPPADLEPMWMGQEPPDEQTEAEPSFREESWEPVAEAFEPVSAHDEPVTNYPYAEQGFRESAPAVEPTRTTFAGVSESEEDSIDA